MISLYKVYVTNTDDSYYFLAENTKKVYEFFERYKQAIKYNNYHKWENNIVPDEIKNIILVSQSVYIKDWSYVASDGIGKIVVLKDEFEPKKSIKEIIEKEDVND